LACRANQKHLATPTKIDTPLNGVVKVDDGLLPRALPRSRTTHFGDLKVFLRLESRCKGLSFAG
jgi:hypothetical protein